MATTNRKYRLYAVGKFWTMMSASSKGEEVASLILPSVAEPIARRSVIVDELTGKVTKKIKERFICSPATELEMTDPDFRQYAHINNNTIREMSDIPGAPFALSEWLDQWVKDVDVERLRIFYGGGVSGVNALVSIMEAAERNEKCRIMCRVRDGLVLEAAQMCLDSMKGIHYPENLYLYREVYGPMEKKERFNMGLDSLFRALFGDKTTKRKLIVVGGDISSPTPASNLQYDLLRMTIGHGVDDFSYFPEDNDDSDITIAVPPACVIDGGITADIKNKKKGRDNE